MNPPVARNQNQPSKIEGTGPTSETKGPLLPAVAEFQSDAVELEERPVPRLARVTVYALSALICGIVVWASVSKIDEVVIASGMLVTTQPTLVVQPLETSIIRSLDAAVGDTVTAGQKLATLDPTFSQADVDQQVAKLNAFDAQVKRLEAEMAGKNYRPLAGVSLDEQLQAALFRQRQAYYRAQLQNFDAQVSSQWTIIHSSSNQARVLEDRRQTLAQVEAAREELFRKEAGSLLLLLIAKDARLDVDTDLTAIQGENARARQLLKKLTAEKQAFIEDYRRATMEELVELRKEQSMSAEELRKMQLRRRMVTLTAPADAVVLELAQYSVGSVVRDAEPIVTLVPLDVPLEAEVSVTSSDIARIADGMDVRIKFDAYPFQKFGTASGSVRVISRDAFEPTQQQMISGKPPSPFFKARIALTDTRLGAASGNIRLLPGMTVSAEIKVGRRTIISYILYPIVKGLDVALREP